MIPKVEIKRIVDFILSAGMQFASLFWKHSCLKCCNRGEVLSTVFTFRERERERAQRNIPQGGGS